MSVYDTTMYTGEHPGRNPRYTGIKGWLLLPAVSIFTTALMLTGLLFTNFQLIHNTLLNDFMAENPQFRASVIAQSIIVGIQLVLLIYVAYLFFRKKRALPSMIISFLTIHLLIINANLVWILSVFKEINIHEYSGAVAAIIMVGSGIPYFVKSKRVRATFVNP